ncbi:MAG: polyprenol monophosphomannose synthase [Micrococcales bacterium]|nr:polyprenol monophosphomannose synthase [Micrococcales bacterium]
MRETLVIIPTYNEIENLEPIVDRVLAANRHTDILVVDDGSPDGTAALADRLAERHPEVSVLHRTVKDGLGGAYLAGFAWGLARGYWALVEMDADGSHHPEELPRLIEALPGHDLVLGSRWVPGGRIENWPRRRLALSRGGNLYTRVALGIDIRDATGGYRVFSADALRRVDLHAVASQGYCFQVDLVWRALQAGLRIIEVPITFTERVRGTSKMSGGIVRESLVRVTGWGIRRRLRVADAALRGRPALPSVRARTHRALPH